MEAYKKFLEDPTRQTSYHKSYLKSIFSLPASPEYTHSETSVASLFRNIGSSVKENEVYSKHSLANSQIRKHFETQWNEFQNKYSINSNIFTFLKSPLAGHSLKNPSNYLNLYPLVPQFSYLSNSARFSNSNPWNPSEFIKGMLATGVQTENEFERIWLELYNNLSITDKDDSWSCFLNQLFNIDSFRETDFEWKLNKIEYTNYSQYSIPKDLFDKINFPAKTFCTSLDSLFKLKKLTTRKQWISLFESFLRMSMATHLIWICEINKRLWSLIWNKNIQYSNLTNESVLQYIYSDFKSFEIDTKSDIVIRNICGEYSESRIGINLMLQYLSSNNQIQNLGSLNDISNIKTFINESNVLLSKEVTNNKIHEIHLNLLDKNPLIQQGKSSFSKNMFEFLRHSLGQKATIDSKSKSFDQCYWIVKKGSAKNSQWYFKLGPVSVLLIVALSIRNKSGNATDLELFLSNFGIIVNPDRILEYTIGRSLLDLGLTNDNPDGEKGIVIYNPFYQF